MVHDVHVTHHKHLRKRGAVATTSSRTKKQLQKRVDNLVYIVGIFGLIMTLPQIFIIWVEQNAAGISVISWSSYILSAIVMAYYGYIHQERPIMVMYSIWVVFYVLVVVGALIYG